MLPHVLHGENIFIKLLRADFNLKIWRALVVMANGSSRISMASAGVARHPVRQTSATDATFTGDPRRIHLAGATNRSLRVRANPAAISSSRTTLRAKASACRSTGRLSIPSDSRSSLPDIQAATEGCIRVTWWALGRWSVCTLRRLGCPMLEAVTIMIYTTLIFSLFVYQVKLSHVCFSFYYF